MSLANVNSPGSTLEQGFCLDKMGWTEVTVN